MEKTCLCTLCGTTFTNKEDLVAHILLQHSGEKPHQPPSPSNSTDSEEQMDFDEYYSACNGYDFYQNFVTQQSEKNQHDSKRLKVAPKEEPAEYTEIHPECSNENNAGWYQDKCPGVKLQKEIDIAESTEDKVRLPSSRQLTNQLLNLRLPIVEGLEELPSSFVPTGIKVIGRKDEDAVLAAAKEICVFTEFECKEENEARENRRNLKRFVCGMCNEVFKEEFDLKIHTFTHNTTDWFTCRMCGKAFSGRYYLLKHQKMCNLNLLYDGITVKSDDMDRHQRENAENKIKEKAYPTENNAKIQNIKLYNCRICKGVFVSASELEKHERIHTSEKPYECQLCGKGFAEKHALMRHEMLHTGEKPYECNMCGKTFTQRCSLSRHRRKHIYCRRYVCKMCGKGFTERGNCKRHQKTCSEINPAEHETSEMILVENISASYLCSICKKCFYTKGELAAHKEIHTYQCKMCSDIFLGESNLNDHIQLHIAGQFFHCNICSKVFAEKNQLLKHEFLHGKENVPKSEVCETKVAGTGVPSLDRKVKCKRFNCNICGKAFYTNAELAKHTRVHTGERPYKCNLCGKRFADNCNLSRHGRVHTGEKPYMCDICGKAFAFGSNLKVHKVVHNKATPHQCEMCDKAFKLPQNLKQHRRLTHHLNPKPEKRDVFKTEFSEDSGPKAKVSENCTPKTEVPEESAEVPENSLAKTEVFDNIKPKTEVSENSTPKTNVAENNAIKTDVSQNNTPKAEKNTPLRIKLKSYECNFCGKAFITESLLGRHLKQLHEHRALQGEENVPKSDAASSVIPNQITCIKIRLKCKLCAKSFDRNMGDVNVKDEVDSSKCAACKTVVFCEVCGEKCVNQKALENHKRKHLAVISYDCSICGKATRSNTELATHIRTHTGERPLHCNICGKTFADKSSLCRHRRVHTGEKPHACEICGRAFALPGTLRIHKMRHTKEAPHKCDMCERAFKLPYELKKHRQRHLNPESESNTRIRPRLRCFGCNLCGKAFYTKANLSNHLLTHSGVKPFQCGICGKAYTTKIILERHMWKHSDGKVHECSKCEKSFDTKHLLMKHKFTHTSKSYPCSVCGKLFIHKNSLKIHEWMHSGEKPYECTICQMRFGLKCILKQHERVHTGERPHKCDVCGKSFRQKSGLSTHKIIHTGEKPFACAVCGKSFTQRGNLRVHAKSRLCKKRKIFK